MGFYVERIIIKNRAPFDSIDLKFNDNSISVLTALNGKGKTTILSYIMDAWVEITKISHPNSYKGKENSYYRISSASFDLNTSMASIVYIRFNNNGSALDYADIRALNNKDWYESTIPFDNRIPYERMQSALDGAISAKVLSDTLSKKETGVALLSSNIITYFPAYRFELPSYLNEEYKKEIQHQIESTYRGYLINPLEVKSNIYNIANWIMDVVLDQEVNSNEITLPDGTRKKVSPPEIGIWKNLNTILKYSLISKFPQKNIRYGIGRRSNSGARLSIMEIGPKSDKLYCPTIFNLSSGELSIISIFSEILRQGDRTFGMISQELFTGVVLIDEVDMHLHIQLQKEVLPSLFTLFPNIQFIISSHSPFLNMGLAEVAETRTTIFDLDNKGIVSSPFTNEIYQSTYEMFLNEKNRYAIELTNVKNELNSLTKPLVITEGKTDIVHILKALSELGMDQSFDVLPVEAQVDGDSGLISLLNQLKLIKQKNKIIGIFDRDHDELTRKYTDPYADLGNNVYAFRIPCPQSRLEQGRDKISIEYLYSDSEIHSILPNETQLFFGNEFSNDSIRRHLVNKEYRLATKDGCGLDKIVENNKGQAVYSNDDVNHLAKKTEFADAISKGQIEISRESWENFRPILDTIEQIINLP